MLYIFAFHSNDYKSIDVYKHFNELIPLSDNVLAAKEINLHLFQEREEKSILEEGKTLFLLGLGKIWLID